MRLRLIFVFIITGAMLMINACGASNSLSYEKYSSENPEIDCNLDYLTGWKYMEQKGSLGSFEQVIFYPPKDKNVISQAAIILTIEKNSQTNPADLDSFTQALVYKRMQFKDAQAIAESKIKLLGAEAMDVQFKYKRTKEMYVAKAELATIQERIIILQRGGNFYILRYENEDAQFNDYIKAFDHIISSLSFKVNQ